MVGAHPGAIQLAVAAIGNWLPVQDCELVAAVLLTEPAHDDIGARILGESRDRDEQGSRKRDATKHRTSRQDEVQDRKKAGCPASLRSPARDHVRTAGAGRPAAKPDDPRRRIYPGARPVEVRPAISAVTRWIHSSAFAARRSTSSAYAIISAARRSLSTIRAETASRCCLITSTSDRTRAWISSLRSSWSRLARPTVRTALQRRLAESKVQRGRRSSGSKLRGTDSMLLDTLQCRTRQPWPLGED